MDERHVSRGYTNFERDHSNIQIPVGTNESYEGEETFKHG